MKITLCLVENNLRLKFVANVHECVQFECDFSFDLVSPSKIHVRTIFQMQNLIKINAVHLTMWSVVTKCKAIEPEKWINRKNRNLLQNYWLNWMDRRHDQMI